MWILGAGLDGPQYLSTYQTTECSDEQPVATESPPTGIVQTIDSRLRLKKHEASRLPGERKIPRGFRVTSLVELAEIFRFDATQSARRRPETPDQTEQQFFFRFFSQESESHLQEIVESEAGRSRPERGHPAQPEEKHRQSRLTNIEPPDSRVDFLNRRMNSRSMPFTNVVSREKVVNQHDGSIKQIAAPPKLAHLAVLP